MAKKLNKSITWRKLKKEEKGDKISKKMAKN